MIPSIFRGSLPSSWVLDPSTNDSLFLPPSQDNYNHHDGASQEFALRYRHVTLQGICQQTKVCEKRLEHEAGWNELVHSRLLFDALDGHASVHFRNM